jgi:hypothetical protein
MALQMTGAEFHFVARGASSVAFHPATGFGTVASNGIRYLGNVVVLTVPRGDGLPEPRIGDVLELPVGFARQILIPVPEGMRVVWVDAGERFDDRGRCRPCYFVTAADAFPTA